MEVKNGRADGGTTNHGHEEAFGGDGQLHFLHCGDGFMFSYTANSQNCALYMCAW